MGDENANASNGPDDAGPESGGPYSWYALGILVLVYIFNFVDRQILSILNEDIKADLGLSDAQMGFLYGTAFAVFYAIFGIPLGRLADLWVRKNMIAVGLFFWSLMTALSGTARGFGSLAAFRVGVGIGESSASPAAFSMLGDYFPPRLRATAVAIYSSGVYIGAGVGMLIGSQIVARWNAAYPDPAAAPFGFAGWQAAFVAVGLPGLIMALWVSTLREPVRGRSEGLVTPTSGEAPLAVLARELATVLPPFTLVSLYKLSGARGLTLNLVTAVVCAAGAWGLTVLVGSASQWIALGIGLYAFLSWVQSLKVRDTAAFIMIFTTRSMVLGVLGFSGCAFVTYGAGYWTAPYFLRVHGESVATVGTILGLTAMIAGWLGVTLGGIVSDLLRARTPLARPWCGLISIMTSLPLGALLFTTDNVTAAYAFNFFFMMSSSFWIGSAIALSNELVIPRMRGTVSATYILTVTFVGLALGPFTIGRISTTLEVGGMAAADALRQGVLWGLTGYVFAAILLIMAMRYLPVDEEQRIERARRLGEPV